MLIPLCSLARNPDGSVVHPTPYEINGPMSENLALTAVGVLAIVVVMAVVVFRVRARGAGIALAALGTVIMLLHPAWTVSMYDGDCGIMRVFCSWLVLSLFVSFLAIQLIVLAWPAKNLLQRIDYDDQFGPSEALR